MQFSVKLLLSTRANLNPNIGRLALLKSEIAASRLFYGADNLLYCRRKAVPLSSLAGLLAR
jgi:hypothetical protein